MYLKGKNTMIATEIELTEEQLSAVTGGHERRHEGRRHHRRDHGWEGRGERFWGYDDSEEYDVDYWRTSQVVFVPTIGYPIA